MKPKRTILCVDDNEQSLSIRCGVNPAWPFANAKSRNHFVRRTVNHCDVARVFIADENEVAWRFCMRGQAKGGRDEKCNDAGGTSHAGSRSRWSA